MNDLLGTIRANFSFSDRRRSNRHSRHSKRIRNKALPKRQDFLLEPLESRLLLSVDFVAGTPVAPAVNRTDVGLGIVNDPVEPAVSINNTDPGNVIVSSHSQLQATFNEGLSFTSTATFPNVPGQTQNQGDTDTAFDSQGRLFWVNLVRFSATQRDVVVSPVNLNPPNTVTLGVPARVPNGNFIDDKPFLAADANPNSPFADNLYVAFARIGQAVPNQWSIYFSRSTDHGVT